MKALLIIFTMHNAVYKPMPDVETCLATAKVVRQSGKSAECVKTEQGYDKTVRPTYSYWKAKEPVIHRKKRYGSDTITSRNGRD